MFSQAQLRPFNPSSFYTTVATLSSPYTPVIQLKRNGIETISRYYEKKYKAKITIPCQQAGTPDNMLQFYTHSLARLHRARCMPSPYREAFIVGVEDGHGTPIIYLKEGKRELLLVADSISRLGNREFFQKLQAHTNIPVCAVIQKQQMDMNSCYTYSVLMGLATTAIHPKTNQYQIPNLLSKLLARSIEREGFYEARLVDDLLKFSQIPDFAIFHKEPIANKIIHKNETIIQFRKRYDDYYAGTMRPNYLRVKGFKMAENIEIQFYTDQLRHLGRELWTKEREDDFITQAKKMLRAKRIITVNLGDGISNNTPFHFHLHKYYKDKLDEVTRLQPNASFETFYRNELAVIQKIETVMKAPKLHQLATQCLQQLKSSLSQTMMPLFARL